MTKVFQGRLIDVHHRPVTLPDGRTESWEIIEHRGAVGILPLKEDGTAVMLRNWRPTVDMYLVEIPAGMMEEGETPEETALRELAEETGYRAGRLEYLGKTYSAVGVGRFVLHMFVATDLEQGERHPDPNEFLELLEIPLDELDRMACAGELEDGKTLSCLKLYEAHRDAAKA